MSANSLSDHLCHHWVSLSPQFQTTLFIRSDREETIETPEGGDDDQHLEEGSAETSADTARQEPQGPHHLDLTLFDFDGVIISQSALEMPRRGTTFLELEPFFGGCRRESGFAHGHLRIESRDPFSSILRVQSGAFAGEVGALRRIGQDALAFFPLMFAPGRSPAVVIVNPSEQEAQIRCRLFVQNRAPDMDFGIAPRGARILFVPIEFAEYLKASSIQNANRGVPGYIRIGAREGSTVYVQLVEETLMPPPNAAAPQPSQPTPSLQGLRVPPERFTSDRESAFLGEPTGSFGGGPFGSTAPGTGKPGSQPAQATSQPNNLHVAFSSVV